MAAVPGIRPPKLSPFWGGFYIFFFSLFISIIFGKSPCAVGRAKGGGLGGLITWHNWRSTLLVAVVLGIRLPNYSIFFFGGGGQGWGGGARLGRGENTFFHVYLFVLHHYVFQCLTVILILLLLFLHACDIFVCSVLLNFLSMCFSYFCMTCDICIC